MSVHELLQDVARPLGDAVRLASGEAVHVSNRSALAGRMEDLARTAALESEPNASLARWLIRAAAAEVGVFPASIDPLYRARGRGETRNDFTVPAMNLRALAFHSARAVFPSAPPTHPKAIVFEIARSEM